MKKTTEFLGSQLVLIFGFLIILFLTFNALVEYQDANDNTQQSWQDMSKVIHKMTLITDIFDAQNKLKNTLDAALIEENRDRQHALFRKAAQIREVIVSGRLALLAQPLQPIEKQILEKQGLLLENGFGSQTYYESLLLEFDDREEAMQVLFSQINQIQTQAQNLFSDYYFLTKEAFVQQVNGFSKSTQASAQTYRGYLLVNLLLILIVGVFVVVTMFRRDRLIHKQTRLLRDQNANLENQVAQRTEHLEKARLAEKQANEAKSEFLAIMSHEIRTPLNGMMGTLSLIDDHKLTPEEKGFLQTARHSSDLLLTVINDILDYSKIESGKFTLAQTPMDLQNLVQNAETVYAPLIKEKGLHFVLDTSGIEHRWMLGDTTRIAQIINNYMNNAIKFTQEGEIRLTIRAQANGLVDLAVSDTGLGIQAEDVAKLFQDFTQVYQGSNRQFGGTGLGLVICRKLAELMGGSVSVDSEYGQGSTFFAQLKLEPISEAAFHESEEQTASEMAQHQTKALRGKILLVEDNKVNQMVAQKLLEKAGHEVMIANNGQEALDKVDEQAAFDMILMDCQMPVMDGFEATRKIREKGWRELPIIALTANAQSSDREACFLAGTDDFISKPFKPEFLLEKVTQTILASREGRAMKAFAADHETEQNPTQEKA